jgi:hypothetical protein
MDIDPEEVFLTRPEFSEYDADFKHFKDCLASLIEQCQAEDDRAEFDSDAFAHDREIHPFPLVNFRGEPQWPGSGVEMWLSVDIDDDRHLELTPKVHATRVEYHHQEYELKTFRGHIYQMIKSRKFLAYMPSRDQ